jgi:hypothetical protein
MKNTPFTKSVLLRSYSKKLVLFLGENDNAQERRGHLVRNAQLDKQGTHRLERGIYFYKKAKEAAKINVREFKWTITIIPGVGHDYKKMSNAAANYLNHY